MFEENLQERRVAFLLEVHSEALAQIINHQLNSIQKFQMDELNINALIHFFGHKQMPDYKKIFKNNKFEDDFLVVQLNEAGSFGQVFIVLNK